MDKAVDNIINSTFGSTGPDAIRNGAEVSTGTVGLITSGVQAEEILQNGRADLIFVSRQLLRDPYWPFYAAKELGTLIEPPDLYAGGW